MPGGRIIVPPLHPRSVRQHDPVDTANIDIAKAAARPAKSLRITGSQHRESEELPLSLVVVSPHDVDHE